jgi:flagellar biosynthesis/type III secretory pathway protein FliH
MKYVRIITIEDFPHSDKDEEGQDLQYIEHYVTVNAKNRKKERFNEITYKNINLPVFRKAIPKERLKKLLKTALEKLLSIYAYSSKLTKEEVEDIYSGDENRIYREAYEQLEMFNWPIERYDAYERSESDRLSMKDKFEQCYEDNYNEGFKNGYNEGRKACFRPILSLLEVLWGVLLVVLWGTSFGIS